MTTTIEKDKDPQFLAGIIGAGVVHPTHNLMAKGHKPWTQ